MKKIIFFLVSLLLIAAVSFGQYTQQGTWFNFTGREKFSKPVLFTATVSPAQITSNQNNYNPTGLSDAIDVRLNSDASRDITGLAGGDDGRLVFLHNVGSNDIVLRSQSTSSTAANRFAFTGDKTISPGESIFLKYDGVSSRWRSLGMPPTPTLQQVLTAGQTLGVTNTTLLNSHDWILRGSSSSNRVTFGSDGVDYIDWSYNDGTKTVNSEFYAGSFYVNANYGGSASANLLVNSSSSISSVETYATKGGWYPRWHDQADGTGENSFIDSRVDNTSGSNNAGTLFYQNGEYLFMKGTRTPATEASYKGIEVDLDGYISADTLLTTTDTTTFKPVAWDKVGKAFKKLSYWPGSGGGGTPDGNYGNVQLNRNGQFKAPGSDSLGYTTSGGFNVKNVASFLPLNSYNTNGYALRVSNFNIQIYNQSNAFFAQNFTFNSGTGNYEYTVGGFAMGLHLIEGQVIAACAASGSGGGTVSLVYPYKGDNLGNFVAGNSASTAAGNLTGGIMVLHGGGGAGFGAGVTDPGAGFVAVEKGLNVKATTLNVATGGVLKDFYTDANNTSTTETDLYSYTTAANTLSNNGEKIDFKFTINCDGTANSRLIIYFAGTSLFDNGASALAAGAYTFSGQIIRTSSTTARVIITPTAQMPGGSTTETDLTGLTLSSTNILKITGTNSSGSNHITAKIGTIFWWPAAN